MRILLFLFLFCSVAQADVYVVYDKTTKEIVTMSEKDDTVIQDGQVMEVIPGRLADIELRDAAQNYKFVNKKFIENVQKISSSESAKEAEAKRNAEEELIFTEMRRQAYEKLKSDGVSFEQVKDSDFMK